MFSVSDGSDGTPTRRDLALEIASPETIVRVATDPFGNYVLQRCVAVADDQVCVFVFITDVN